jgi:hypothetical protein
METTEKYPELIRRPECAEQFFNEYKGVMPDSSLLAGFNFALNCDNFHYAFNRYLLNDNKSFYRIGQNLRQYYAQNADNPRRAALFSVFIQEYLDATQQLLLNREYYELMPRFEDAKKKVTKLVAELVGQNNLPT